MELSAPESARNPHGFDYKRYLRWQGVYVIAKGTVSDSSLTPSSTGWLLLAEKWRRYLSTRLSLAFPDEEVAGYMKSLLLGERDEVSPHLEEMYADLGIIHVLAISGLHVTVVTVFFLWLLQRIGITRETALTLALLLLGAYVATVGAGDSALRAGIMGGLGIWLLLVKRAGNAREGLGFALIVMLAHSPYSLWHIGFQLSFVVTLGLIEYVPLFRQGFIRFPPILRDGLAVTCAAQLVSFPFLVYWFHQISPLSWPLNLIVVPLLSFVVLPLGYISLLLALVHPAWAALPSFVSSTLLEYVHEILKWLHLLPVPFRHWPHPSPWWLVVTGLVLVGIVIAWKRGYHRTRDRIVYGIALLALVVWARHPWTSQEEIRITFLDVGQGDSIVVELPGKKVYVIDSGGTFSVSRPDESWRSRRDPHETGKDIVLPFLRARGIERIDTFVITHGDWDHIGGAASVIGRMPVGTVLFNGWSLTSHEQRLLSLLQKREISVRWGEPGMTWSDGPDIHWTWLWPSQEFVDSAATENQSSIVLLLEAFGKRVLFTGDLTGDREQELMQRYSLPDIDVLKVGHHGSKTSTEEPFLDVLRPEAAVISVGRGNWYGHPSPVVLERLEIRNIPIFRTDLHGAVTLVMTPDGLTWDTQLERVQ